MPRKLAVGPAPPPRLTAHLDAIAQLESVHRGYAQAAAEIERVACIQTCVPGCGRCCEENNVMAYGIEADCAVQYLLGHAELLNPVVDACRAWLLRPGKWSYGARIDLPTWERLRPEFARATRERCPFLTADKRCLIHEVRPIDCRAFSVTRQPGPLCKRPRSFMETEGNYAYWDAHNPTIPLYGMVEELKRRLAEPEWSVQGFFPTLIFQRLRAKELAGYWDDGRVPMVKMAVGWGDGYMVLWQEQIGGVSAVTGADRAIEHEAPIDWRQKRPLLTLTAPRRRA